MRPRLRAQALRRHVAASRGEGDDLLGRLPLRLPALYIGQNQNGGFRSEQTAVPIGLLRACALDLCFVRSAVGESGLHQGRDEEAACSWAAIRLPFQGFGGGQVPCPACTLQQRSSHLQVLFNREA